MPVGLLVVFKYVLIALIWLFFIRALRAVYVQVRPPKVKAEKAVATPSIVKTSPLVERKSNFIGSNDKGSTSNRVRLGVRALGVSGDASNTWPVDSFVTIGRSSGCTISISEDEFSSSVHCRLTKTDSDFLIEDLGSTNGTFLNGELVKSPTPLSEGDEISAGRSRFKVVRL
ncbi:MAG: FHA domain-containing protein [Actinomycetota bacterium]|nr:FHA domain-containing protein [Actinomycetota bacterium]